MLFVGAGGLSAQLYEDFISTEHTDVTFWSEYETKYAFLKEKFSFIKNDSEVVEYFKKNGEGFVVCIGGVENRRALLKRFEALGGVPKTYISARSTISPFSQIGNGTLILSRVEVEANVEIGENCLLNKTSNIAHGSIIGNNCEIAPGVILLGEVTIGNDCSIGTGCVVLPKVKIGNNVTLSAGSYVKKNVPDNAVVAGTFATVKFFRKV